MKMDIRNSKTGWDCGCSGGGCCGPTTPAGVDPGAKGVTGPGVRFVSVETEAFIPTTAGKVPVVPDRLSRRDRLGAVMVRLGLRRMSYAVAPGLYAVGKPGAGSPILVSANYKLSFDKLRSELHGVDAWLLVLDSKGINVWCAAGKGTLGTEELVERIARTGLRDVAGNGTIVLPQLSAPGVAAYEVVRRTKFKVVFGPARARDIQAFLRAGLKADKEMRTVRFTLLDRLVLVPVELTAVIKLLLAAAAALIGLEIVGVHALVWEEIYPFLGAIVTGCVLTPVLLPWIPSRPFAWKGWLLGFLWAVFVNYRQGLIFGPAVVPAALAWFLMLPAISAFLAMNFTGSSTYTSLSGVVREMKYAVPAIVVSGLAGTALYIIGLLAVRG